MTAAPALSDPRGARLSTGATWRRPLAGAVLATVGLVVVSVGATVAVFTHTSTIADNSFATLDLVPPSNVTATFDCGTLGLGKGILVEWDSVSDAEGYEVARSTDSGGPYTTIASVDASTTQYMDNDVENNTTYYYVVRSTASGWVSENSAEASETTPGSTDCLL